MRQTQAAGQRQRRELMLCGGAAKHQLTLISDSIEITDAYPSPPDLVQSANHQLVKSQLEIRYSETKRQHRKTKSSEMRFADLKWISSHYFRAQNVLKAGSKTGCFALYRGQG